jgi:hypothetical protein
MLNLYFLTINDNRGHLVRCNVLNELFGTCFCIIFPEIDLLGLLLRLVVHLIGIVIKVPHDTAIVLVNKSAILLDFFSFLCGFFLPLLLYLHHGNQLFEFFFTQVLRPVLPLPLFFT